MTDYTTLWKDSVISHIIVFQDTKHFIVFNITLINFFLNFEILSIEPTSITPSVSPVPLDL